VSTYVAVPPGRRAHSPCIASRLRLAYTDLCTRRRPSYWGSASPWPWSSGDADARRASPRTIAPSSRAPNFGASVPAGVTPISSHCHRRSSLLGARSRNGVFMAVASGARRIPRAEAMAAAGRACLTKTVILQPPVRPMGDSWASLSTASMTPGSSIRHFHGSGAARWRRADVERRVESRPTNLLHHGLPESSV
jgi:hypothetical protein